MISQLLEKHQTTKQKHDMQKGAILIAASNIINQITESKKKASQCFRQYFNSNKYAGAKDKKLIETLVYSVLKNYFALEKIFKTNNILFNNRNILLFIYFKKYSEHDLSDLYSGKYSLKKEDKDKFICTFSKNFNDPLFPILPDWLKEKLKNSLSDKQIKEFFKSIMGHARLDLRINSMHYKREKVISLLNELNIEAIPTKVSPLGITIQKKIPENKLKKNKWNYFEVQDEGSQIMSLLSGVEPYMKVLDYCAGKGTKTLALYDLMNGKGELLAHEKDQVRSSHLQRRLKKLRLNKIKVIEYLEDYNNYFDLVLVDVPCSGSGTWKRRPEDLLRLKKADYENLLKVQQDILNKSAFLCKSNGLITYLTCSIFEEENEQQINKFLKKNKNFERVDIKNKFLNNYLDFLKKKDKSCFTLLPNKLNTDGYFISSIKKKT